MQCVILTFYAFDHKIGPISNQTISKDMKNHIGKYNTKNFYYRYALVYQKKRRNYCIIHAETTEERKYVCGVYLACISILEYEH